MVSYLRRTISLNNLRDNTPPAQIATLLILVMVAILLLILVTVNIGQISITTTNLANATDSASLSLASQLGTKSRFLVETLGFVKKCKSTGFLSKLLATIGAIIGFCIAGPAGAVIGGSIGGGIGGSIDGTGALNGAIQGAIIGASIAGAGYVGGAEMFGAWGAPAFITLTAAGTIYNAVQNQRMTEAALSNIAKALNGLPEKERLREGTFFNVLSMTIDDPNTTEDTFDSDSDGDITEKVPYFQRWFDLRLRNLKENITKLEELVGEFFAQKGVDDAAADGALTRFQITAEGWYYYGGYLDRSEYQAGEVDPLPVKHWDGVIVKLARGLEEKPPASRRVYVTFWEPGDARLLSTTCSDCDPPQYRDEVDEVANELRQIVEMAKTLRREGADQLAFKWEDWLSFFYDASTTSDYFNTLQVLIDGKANFIGLKAWRKEIIDKRKFLPECTCSDGICIPGSGQVCSNPPCKISTIPGSPYYGTIDANLDDEFTPAISAIDDIINVISDFRPKLASFGKAVAAAANNQGPMTLYGGADPVHYRWCDSRCSLKCDPHYNPLENPNYDFNNDIYAHRITVSAHIPIPYVDTWEEGDWYDEEACIGVINATADPSVTVTRIDPPDQNLGVLGKWNPFGGSITRKSVAHFTYTEELPTIRGTR